MPRRDPPKEQHPLDPEDDTFQQLKWLREELHDMHAENKKTNEGIYERLAGIEDKIGEIFWAIRASRFFRAAGRASVRVSEWLEILGRWLKKVLVPFIYVVAAWYFARALFSGETIANAARAFWHILER
jgi:hypothetical protein